MRIRCKPELELWHYQLCQTRSNRPLIHHVHVTILSLDSQYVCVYAYMMCEYNSRINIIIIITNLRFTVYRGLPKAIAWHTYSRMYYRRRRTFTYARQIALAIDLELSNFIIEISRVQYLRIHDNMHGHDQVIMSVSNASVDAYLLLKYN